MPGCASSDINIECPCTYTSCSKRGKCCECVANHQPSGQFPACFFTPKMEKTYDRSFAALCRDRGR